jgi:uncharacterized protein
MKCPHCNEMLLMSERHNIQIDYCPACRGIWLDKGELDKMLEYAAAKTEPTRNYQSGMHDASGKHNKPYKKKSFLGDLFDFD